MIITSKDAEHQAIMNTAAAMCAAARTAPKTRGIDNIVTKILTEGDLVKLSDLMQKYGEEGSSMVRDAGNVLNSHAVVLIGVKKATYGLNCTYCGFDSCASCEEGNGACIFATTDLGIALGSAVSIAADNRIDNRIMYSIGKAIAMDGKEEDKDIIWMGIPLAAKGKSPYYDRKKDKK